METAPFKRLELNGSLNLKLLENSHLSGHYLYIVIREEEDHTPLWLVARISEYERPVGRGSKTANKDQMGRQNLKIMNMKKTGE